jgi:hypothetical protein
MTLFVSIIAIVLFSLLYYKNLYQSLFRIGAVIILFFIITNRALSYRSKKEIHPPVILIDCSASMTHHISAIIQEVNTLPYPHTTFFFSESLITPARSGITPTPGRFTDITRALTDVSELRPSAIIIVSDGNHNYGTSPRVFAEHLTAPVYCFGVGDVTGKDISITDMVYPAYAFQGDSVKIEAIVESGGFSSGKGEIWLQTSSGITGKKTSFFLSDVTAKTTVDFWIHVTEPGVEKIHVYITPHADEESRENNSFDFSLEILDKKINVLYVTDHVSFNTKFILRALNEDYHVALFPLVKMTKDRYQTLDKGGDNTTIPLLDNFDAVVFDNVNYSTLPWHDIEMFLSQGKGVLCCGAVEGLTNEWRAILPITVVENSIDSDHPITIVYPFSLLSVEDRYPPFSHSNKVIGLKENAVVIAEADHSSVIAYRDYRGGVVFQINATEIGSWQFLQAGIKHENMLSRFIGDIIRFISPLGQRTRLVLTSLRRNYAVGETVTLTLQSYDRNFRRAGSGDFYCDIGNTPIPFFEISEGRYEATFVAKEDGALKMVATGKLSAEILHSDTLTIIISPQAVEAERGLNRQLLQPLAEMTGGSYHSLDELATFTPPHPGEQYSVKNIHFNSPISYVLIFIFLAIDWSLRRRRGIV